MMDYPGIHRKMLTEMEEFIGSEKTKQLSDSMRKATEVKEHAISSLNLHQGVPAITVVVDGGWSKQSHEHLYNAKAGLQLFLDATPRNYVILGSGTNSAQCLPYQLTKEQRFLNTTAFVTGVLVPHQWRVTSEQRDFPFQRVCMACNTCP